VNAGNGVDAVYGDDGDDVLRGGAGRDRIAGGFNADVIFGGDGDDLLMGTVGRDALHGGPGSDACLDWERDTDGCELAVRGV
jgi:Ca2+-binding RTX toxin-like protein